MCGIAIEDDREVMDVLKCMLDGKSVDDDLLPELLKMNKGKLIKCILTLIH
jgi:transcription initiation factor IIE alpha subunit